MIRLYVKVDKSFRRELVDKGVIKKTLAATLKDSGQVFLTALRKQTPVGIADDSPTLQKNWMVKRKTDLGYSFRNPTPYAYIVDQGRFRGVGKVNPRTVAGGPIYKNGTGIFSTQAPRGITYPYFEHQGTDADWIKDVLSDRFHKFFRKFSKAA